MPNGRPTRRTTPRFARGFLVVCVSLAAGAGCQRLPLRHLDVAPDSTSEPTTRADRGAGEPKVLPALPSAPLTRAETEGAPAEGPSPRPTPLLDAALARAGGLPTGPDAAPEIPAPVGFTPVSAPAEADERPADTTPPPKADPAPAVPDVADAKKAQEPEPTTPPKESTESAAPRDGWGDTLSRLRDLARRRAGGPGEEAEAWAIRSRVLDWLAGEGHAPEAVPDRAWNQVLAALSTATSPETAEPEALAHHLGAAVDALEAYVPLRINDLRLCGRVVGFGHYEPMDATKLHPGQEFLVYCEVAGLKYEESDGGLRSRLSSRVEVVPAAGGAPVLTLELPTPDDSCGRRHRDNFVNYRLALPRNVAPGLYSLRMTQTDLVSGRSASAEIALTVVR